MRKLIILSCAVFFMLAGNALPFNDGHSQVTGIVNQISNDSIVIDYATDVLSPKCKVNIQYKVDNAFYLKPARVGDIRRGDSVVVMKLANTVTELTIERWKR